MSVTINDVANEAGVSKSTVSKVLNHWTTISPATVEKVHAAIEKLHYTPNSRAVYFQYCLSYQSGERYCLSESAYV